MNILAIGAHFDDLELGCGGALARHAESGDSVIGYIATLSGYANAEGKIIRDSDTAKKEGKKAADIIGYKLICGDCPTFQLEFDDALTAKLVGVIEEVRPNIIYTHFAHDAHHDHRALALAVLHSSRHIPRILMYRSNWYEGALPFNGSFFVDITKTWQKKEEALKTYKSEMGRTDSAWLEWQSREVFLNGQKAGVKYAEAFQMVRWLE